MYSSEIRTEETQLISKKEHTSENKAPSLNFYQTIANKSTSFLECLLYIHGYEGHE